MFYNDNAIQTLIGRIGWAGAIPPSNIVLSAANLEADSGRYVSDFHKLAIVENLKDCMPNADATANTLQSYLQEMKRGAVRQVLGRIFNSNERAWWYLNSAGEKVNISNRDYSDQLIAEPYLLDNAIGFQLAYDSLEVIGTTIRSNRIQRLAETTYEQIKTEQDGYTNERGIVVSPGIKGRLTEVIGNIIDILFPAATNANRGIRDKSMYW